MTWCAFAAALLFFAPAASSQSQQYVYAPNSSANTLAGFVKDAQSGALASAPGSPFPARIAASALAVDPTGRFLFAITGTSGEISMFQINRATGTLAEVPNSPFAAAGQNPATVIATEQSGKYLYVGSTQTSGLTASGWINIYSIDAGSLALVPVSASPVSTSPYPVAFSTDPKGRFLFTYNGQNVVTGNTIPDLRSYGISPLTGDLSYVSSTGMGEDGSALVMDPKGRFVLAGHGRVSGFLDSYSVSPVDGSLIFGGLTEIGQAMFPRALAVESGGKFLYVVVSPGLLRGFAIDQATGALAELASSPFRSFTVDFPIVGDPQGPFLYTSVNGTILGLNVDPATGNVTPLSPMTPPSGLGGAIAITGEPVQPVVGPDIGFQPRAADFNTIVVGQASQTLVVYTVNIGNQPLAISGVSVIGPNRTDFTETNNCATPLPPNANCSMSVIFTPSAPGLRTAALSIADNASGSPQTVSLQGTGQAPAPAITVVPGSVTFPDTTTGNSAAAQVVTLTNSGTASLALSNISLGGPNPGDFSETHTCGAALAVNASCTVSVTFKPAAVGQRTATLAVTDDALDSPQTIALTGTGNPPFTVQPSGSSSTTQTVNPGQTAQYDLQVAPVTGFTGSVSLSCAGAPLGAKCQVSPASVQLAGSNPVPFSVVVSTSAGSALPWAPRWPGSYRAPFKGFPLGSFLAPFLLLLLWWVLTQKGENFVRRRRIAWSHAAAGFLLLAAMSVVGCGGGSVNTLPPPALVTPPGTFTLTVSAMSNNITQKIQLKLTVK